VSARVIRVSFTLAELRVLAAMIRASNKRNAQRSK
jgi:hypothetical protein